MLKLADLVPGESPCLRVAVQDGQPVACGLLYRHDGVCVSFTPGDYLPPPILHLLDLLLFSTSCPLCGEWAMPPEGELVTAFRGGLENWDRSRPEWQWTFRPCGCTARNFD